MTHIKISSENARLAYNIADDKTKEVLNVLLGGAITPQDNRPIEERVKTYEDACKVLGVEPRTYEDLPYDVAAYLKLRTIAEALNEGWLPQFTEKKYRYYPQFLLYTQKEIDDIDEDSKKGLVAFGGHAMTARVRASLARIRVPPPRLRLRLSVLTFVSRPESLRYTVVSSSQIYGLISAL